MLVLRFESIICDFQIYAEIIAHKERFANKRSFTAMFSSFLLIDTLILFSSLNIYIIYILNLERIHRKQAHPKTGFVMFIRWLRLFYFLCVLGLQLELLLTLSVYASSAFKAYSKDTIFLFHILLLFYTKRKSPIQLILLFYCIFLFLVLLCLYCSISSLFLVTIAFFQKRNVV